MKNYKNIALGTCCLAFILATASASANQAWQCNSNVSVGTTSILKNISYNGTKLTLYGTGVNMYTVPGNQEIHQAV
jgi:hypothetical protein